MARHKKEHHEEHPDERWLVTFADMMVLLVAVFIVLWAMSSATTVSDVPSGFFCSNLL